MPRADQNTLLDVAANLSLAELMQAARELRDRTHGSIVTYSKKVFIPLTELCRDVCHYCTYAKTPRRVKHPYMLPDQVEAIARDGQRAGCREALFTLGDKPELRYQSARDALKTLGCETTVDYLERMAARVIDKTGLLPHLNPGVLSRDDYERLRAVAPSMGIMLESASDRLCERGGPHYGSPDKAPTVRLQSIAEAGEARVPLTSGILIGIGENRQERVDSLIALRDLHDRYGHIQEIIVQNFVPKPDTKMHAAPAAATDELLWTVALARIVFGADMSIQAPPNLSEGRLAQLIDAGINDWGGVSPVTPDHINPESPWPQLDALSAQTRAAGKWLTQRLTVYPRYVAMRDDWIHPRLHEHVLHHADSTGLARDDRWSAGLSTRRPYAINVGRSRARDRRLQKLVDKAASGVRLSEPEVARLFTARGDDFANLCAAADELRRSENGDDVTYVVNRNINYTNLCKYHCEFCAFSKGKVSDELRGTPYVLDQIEIARRTEEAWSRGATEVCLQGGIHPAFTGQTYLDICRSVKEAAPDIHVHAFSPLEVTHGAQTLRVSIETFLRRLKGAGLASLPGTAAEILDDEVRALICPDKLTTEQWIDVIEAAHRVGIATTSTIMFGHLETPLHWARHLLALRDLQQRTGGITEYVPLPFVHMEAPLYYRGRARLGPTYRETVLMHAVARLVLHPLITNIQVSWVKMGNDGASDCLRAGANDLGGTLMNESISRAAGASHGQELGPQAMEKIIARLDRVPVQRTTLYGEPAAERVAASFAAMPLKPVNNRHAREFRAGESLAPPTA